MSTQKNPACECALQAWARGIFSVGASLIVAVVALGATGPIRTASAAEAVPHAIPQAGHVGGLHRVAVTLEAALDIHRLALVEIIAATRKALEAGRQTDATSAALLPQATMEVYARVSKSVAARLAEDALPAVARAYNAEAREAISDLGRAETLGSVVGPLRAYASALERVLGQADDVVDVFSRVRPVQAKVVDADTALDDIGEALNELSRAENLVSRTRGRDKPLADQLRAFMRLEIALGHALDLIAEAQESGVHIGFEAPVPTTSLINTMSATRAHLSQLAAVVRVMETPPAALGGQLVALMSGPNASLPYETRLDWQAPNPVNAPATLRVYRQYDKQKSVEFLAQLLACESGDVAGATGHAQDQVKALDSAAVLVAELAPGRSSLSETIAANAPVLAPPWYRVVPVSVFGVEGPALETKAVLLPRSTEPVFATRAALMSRSATDPNFYRDGDRVEVQWEASRSELLVAPSADARVVEWARDHKLPTVKQYRVLRRTSAGDIEVCVAPAGVHVVSDRPSSLELKQGVSYLVETITEQGTASPTQACTAAVVSADAVAAFSAAAAGSGYLKHPTGVERELIEGLKDEKKKAQAVTAFLTRPAAEREALRRAWWSSLDEPTRVSLLRRWATYVAPADEAKWVQQAIDHLSTRDRAWVMVELWLLTQPPWMQREIDRWWYLIDEASKRQAMAKFWSQLNAAHRLWVEQHFAGIDVDPLRPLRVQTWWHSRDAAEQQHIEDWWIETKDDERARLFTAWLEDQAPVVKRSVRWPDWEQRTASERSLLLHDGSGDLPVALVPGVLAWEQWQAQTAMSMTELIRREIPWWQRALAKVRFAARPLDVALGFHLWTLVSVVCALLLLGVVWRKRRRA